MAQLAIIFLRRSILNVVILNKGKGEGGGGAISVEEARQLVLELGVCEFGIKFWLKAWTQGQEHERRTTGPVDGQCFLGFLAPGAFNYALTWLYVSQ